jgi:hypothetical protein
MATLLDGLDTYGLTSPNMISWGCPVPFFGHIESARVATVGINPSNREFVSIDGTELSAEDRRLPTLASLGLSCWGEANFTALHTILSACREYFERNPYIGWFGILERIIQPTGHSFYTPLSSACHLDIVPWATAVKWGTLSSAARNQLVGRAALALGEMVSISSLRMLVLNGQEVVRQFEALLEVPLQASRMPAWDLPRRSGREVAGMAYNRWISSIAGIPLDRDLLVVGYNHNLQSSFGVTAAVRHNISEWIAAQHGTVRW